MLTIYGHPMSTCTRKVLTTLAENGTAHDFVVVDFGTGAHKQPEHMARQPFGQVPTLNDDGFTMYESRAMCRYLNEKAGGALAPRDLQGRARMEQWLSIESANFTPHAMKFVYQYVFQRPQDPAVLEAAAKGLATALGVMDAHLATHANFAGDSFSLADISFMPYFEYAMMTPASEIISKYPHVSAWWSAVSARPSWQKATGKA